MTDSTDRPKRRWQNLLYKSCPNCGSKLEEKKLYLICPNPHPTEEHKSCFFIKKERAAELLRDEAHPAHICLSATEKQTLESVITGWGIA